MTKKLSQAYRFTGTLDGLQFIKSANQRSRELRTGAGGHHIPGTPFVYKHWWKPVTPFIKKPGDLKKGDVVDVNGQPHMVAMVAADDGGKMHLGLKKMPEGTKVTVRPEGTKPLGQPNQVKVIGQAGRGEWEAPGVEEPGNVAVERRIRKMEQLSYGEGLGHPEYGQPAGAKHRVERRLSDGMKTPTDDLIGAAYEVRPWNRHGGEGSVLGDPAAMRRRDYENDLRGITADWDGSSGIYDGDTVNGEPAIFLIRREDGSLSHGDFLDLYSERDRRKNVEYVRINPEDDPELETKRVEKIKQMYRDEEVRNLVAQWAASSNDQNAVMLAMQEIVAEDFGIDNPYGWDYDVDTARTVKAIKEKNGPALRDFLHTQYEETQADLKRAGITKVRVYRGYDWQKNEVAGKEHPAPDWAMGHERGDEIDIPPQRPLSSWAYSSNAADMFAGSTHSVILSADIPSEDVLSTPQSGFGCLNEDEVVVIGGSGGKATTWKVGYNLQPLAGIAPDDKKDIQKALDGWNGADQDKLYFEAQMFAGLLPGDITAVYILKQFPPKPGMDYAAYNAYLKSIIEKIQKKDFSDPKVKKLAEKAGVLPLSTEDVLDMLSGVMSQSAAKASHYLAELMEIRYSARASYKGHHIPGTPTKYKHGWILKGPGISKVPEKPSGPHTLDRAPDYKNVDWKSETAADIKDTKSFCDDIFHPNGIKSRFTGKIDTFPAKGKLKHVQGLLTWDGDMMVKDDVAVDLALDRVSPPDTDVTDIEDYDTILHEMIHSYSDVPGDQDRIAFQTGTPWAEIEEGFTTVASAAHLPDFIEREGLGDRETTYVRPDWSFIGSVENFHGSTIPVIKKRMTMRQAAKERGDIDTIREGHTLAYPKLAQAAMDIVDRIADQEGKKTKKAKTARALELADEINRVGTANKRFVIAKAIMRAFGDDNPELESALADRVTFHWAASSHPGETLMAWYKNNRDDFIKRAQPEDDRVLTGIEQVLRWIWKDAGDKKRVRRGLEVLTNWSPKDPVEALERSDAVKLVMRLMGNDIFAALAKAKAAPTRHLAELMNKRAA